MAADPEASPAAAGADAEVLAPLLVVAVPLAVAAVADALEACAQDAAKICPGLPGGGVIQACLAANSTAVSKECKAELDASPLEFGDTPSCYSSPICGNRITGIGSGLKGRVQWKTTLAYTPSYPFTDLPGGGGGMVSVAIDSKDNLWALQCNAAGKPQLFKLSSVPTTNFSSAPANDVITHHVKAHGIKVGQRGQRLDLR